jgi:hypothetical protein
VTSSLRAAARANGTPSADRSDGDPATPTRPTPLPDIEYTGAIDRRRAGARPWVALARVMADVQSIAQERPAQRRRRPVRVPWRRPVVNAVGPALRRHGVMVIPVKIETTYGTSGRMREVQVNVTYDIIGPQHDAITAASVGEGLDVGERGTTKALTNAYRNLLIAALTLPTEDPKLDPDKVNIEREEAARPKASDYLDEVVHPGTSLARLRTMRGEVSRHGLASTIVVNEVGDDEKLLDLIDRIGRERNAAGGAA